MNCSLPPPRMGTCGGYFSGRTKHMEAANSPMKRKENDLNQTSREFCSMLIFRCVLLCLYTSRSDFLFGFAGLVLEDARKEAGGTK